MRAPLDLDEQLFLSAAAVICAATDLPGENRRLKAFAQVLPISNGPLSNHLQHQTSATQLQRPLCQGLEP